MSTFRKHTVFRICPAHAGWFSGASRQRVAETFCEGGPANSTPCSGEGCSIRPGTDFFVPSLCAKGFAYDTKGHTLNFAGAAAWTEEARAFAWAVNQ